jgi:hypothetical protein
MTFVDCVIVDNEGGVGGGVANAEYGTVSLTRVTLHGNAADKGGGVWDNQGTTTMADCLVCGNEATYGGGVYAYKSVELTITDSTISENSATRGGGVHAEGDLTLTVRNSQVVANTARSGGGGMYSEASLDLSECTVSNNMVEGGAGICGGGIDCTASAVITNSIISGNWLTSTASSVPPNYPYGGGVHCRGDLTLTGCVVSGNSAVGLYASGGGVVGRKVTTISDSVVSNNWAEHDAGGVCNLSRMTVRNSTISGNSAALGGGILNHGVTLSLTDSQVSDNTARPEDPASPHHNGYGGGIRSLGSLVIERSVIRDNVAAFAAGIQACISAHVTNSTLTGNVADVDCGGLWVVSGCSASLVNSAILDNRAEQAGGGVLIDGGTITVQNSIVALNEAPTDPDVFGPLSAETDYSLIGVWTGAEAPGENSLWGTVEAPLDPMLAFLYGSDGEFRGHRPLPGSPVTDAGLNTLAVDAEGAPLLTDAVGNSRIAGTAVDMGVAEIQGAPQLVVAPMAEVEIAEGASAVIDVSLSEAPLAPVAVTIVKQPGASDDIAMDTSVLTFDGSNWDTPQSVTVSVLEDTEGDIDSAVLTFSTSTDAVHIPILVVDDDPQIYVVNSLGNSVAADGQLTLHEALQATNLNLAAGDAPAGRDDLTDIITFDPGLTGQTISLKGIPLFVEDDLRIDGLGAELLTIDGGEFSRVLNVASQVDFTLSGVTVSGGVADAGGGVYNRGRTTITDTVIRGNEAVETGGAIYNDGGDWNAPLGATLTLNRTTVSDNRTTDAAGYGGGVYNAAFAKLFLNETTIQWNQAFYGGGVYNHNGMVSAGETAFLANRATHGGGIMNSGYAQLTIDLSEELADEYAGIYGAPTLDIRNSVFVGNQAFNGGAVNSSVGGSNSLMLDGGGVVASYSAATTLTNGAIACNNASNTGGGVHGSPIYLANTVVALNDAASGADVSGSVNWEEGSNLVGVDPQFIRTPDSGADQDWGTEDDDYGDLRLLPTSPAINVGDNALAVDNAGDPIATDFDGRLRVIYGTIDIGAYEYVLGGDTNYDGKVNLLDAAILAANFGDAGRPFGLGDVNGDGAVDQDDAQIMAANWGKTYTPPAVEFAARIPRPAIPFVGPLPAGDAGIAGRRLIVPPDRHAGDAESASTASATQLAAACDVVLSKQSDRESEEAIFAQRELAWVNAVARRERDSCRHTTGGAESGTIDWCWPPR